ncbi:putative metal-dependent hydrolase [bacterium]|nr:putative metal-dependent hydrolase [bacterium]
MDIEKLKYPIGKYDGARPKNAAERALLIEQLRKLPGELRAAIAGLSEAQLDTPYREGGWTVRQLVHHIADSHMNALVRTKFALTEGTHAIKAYNQTDWVNTPDATLAPEVSLKFLEALHEKLTHILSNLSDTQYASELTHPERPGQELDLNWLLGLYSWHGRHHTAHITRLRERMGW